eukprot:Blabericola_migrator_1__5520@NODE_2816_length_2322_cov_33_959645_g1766_i0_p3_GENE_NODE_2816_length_2322_cov_33_959645_g1766_i0NODE_2816_length_2322_cov_33_959645_g1766_i0_p3_ORF_typecomplete_len112_score13_42_NODE_2816_length_2322_cov_33_959645_g1766_i018652200
MQTLFDDDWSLAETFASSLDVTKDAEGVGPLTAVCIIAEDNFDAGRVVEVLDLPVRNSYPAVSVYHECGSDYVYLLMGGGVKFDLGPNVRKAATLCCAVSDTVVMVASKGM